MLLLCTVVMVIGLVGVFLKNYADVLLDKVGDKILDAFYVLAFG
jgi:hypothetical protein